LVARLLFLVIDLTFKSGWREQMAKKATLSLPFP